METRRLPALKARDSRNWGKGHSRECHIRISIDQRGKCTNEAEINKIVTSTLSLPAKEDIVKTKTRCKCVVYNRKDRNKSRSISSAAWNRQVRGKTRERSVWTLNHIFSRLPLPFAFRSRANVYSLTDLEDSYFTVHPFHGW